MANFQFIKGEKVPKLFLPKILSASTSNHSVDLYIFDGKQSSDCGIQCAEKGKDPKSFLHK